MTRFSDLDPEQQAAHLAGVQRSLDRADQALAETEAWRAERRDNEWEEQRQARQRREDEEWQRQQQTPEPASRAPRAPERDWRAEQRWVEQIIDQRVGKATRKWSLDWMEKFAEFLGKEAGKTGREFRAEIAETNTRLAKSDVAVTELLIELEHRIAALEQRETRQPPPTRPRLIAGRGGDDAA